MTHTLTTTLPEALPNVNETPVAPGIKRLRILSDIHLEFYPGVATPTLLDEIFPVSPLGDEKSTCLVLAGDISCMRGDLETLYEYCSDRFGHTIHVPGNHEAYGSSIEHKEQEFAQFRKAYGNVSVGSLVRMQTLRLDPDWWFCFGTFWTNMGTHGSQEERFIQRGMNDFVEIKAFGENLRPSLVRGFHQSCVMSLAAEMGALRFEENLTKVVITHHLPSFQAVSEEYRRWPESRYNIGYASDSDQFLDGSVYNPDLWVHGHSHDALIKRMGRCLVVRNPLGYPSQIYPNRDYIVELTKEDIILPEENPQSNQE